MSLPHIILGFLKSVGPLSGYDLKQIIDQSTMHFWYCDLSQIYRALDTIATNAWGISSEDPDNNRQRKVYTITPQGEAELRQWLAGDFENDPVREPNLARLFFGRLNAPTRTREQLIAYRDEIAAGLAQYQMIATLITQTDSGEPVDRIYWHMTVDMGIKVSQALINWCNTCLERLDMINQIEED